MCVHTDKSHLGADGCSWHDSIRSTSTRSRPRHSGMGTLADIASIPSWNPGVVESHLIGDQPSGTGAQRYCNLGGRNYVEESVASSTELAELTMRNDKSNLPFKYADVHFKLEGRGNQTSVDVSLDYTTSKVHRVASVATGR